MQNWKTQRPARNEMALMFGEAAALPCVLEEQVQIARLLTAYDRWLVCCPTKATPLMTVTSWAYLDSWQLTLHGVYFGRMICQSRARLGATVLAAPLYSAAIVLRNSTHMHSCYLFTSTACSPKQLMVWLQAQAYTFCSA